MTDLDRIAAPNEATAAEFIQQFREIWTAPNPERIDALMHPDVRYTQPLLHDVVGRRRCVQYWRRMFVLIPDLRLDVLGAAGSGRTVFMEFVIRGTLGRQQLHLPAVDRYELDGSGLVLSRVLYCDPIPLVGLVLRPSALAQIVSGLTRAGIKAVAGWIQQLITRARR